MKTAVLLTILFLSVVIPAPGQTPRHVDPIYRGLERQRNGDLAGAIEEFTKAIETMKGMRLIVAYVNRANARMEKSEWDGAIADYSQAIERQLNPGRDAKVADKGPSFVGVVMLPPIESSYNNPGNARQAKGDADGAIADYNKALETNPRFPDAYYNRGIALQAKGDLDGAIKDYSAALELMPNTSDAYVNRGMAKHNKKDFDGAIADYNAAIALKNDDASIYFARGTSRDEIKDLEGALADYSRAIELDANLAQAYANRAVIETLQGKISQADQDFDKAFKIDPSLKPRFKVFIENRKRLAKP